MKTDKYLPRVITLTFKQQADIDAATFDSFARTKSELAARNDCHHLPHPRINLNANGGRVVKFAYRTNYLAFFVIIYAKDWMRLI